MEEQIKEKSYSEENLNELQLYLIANGLSNCRSTYNNSVADQAYRYYMSRPPKDIAFLWNYLDDRVKVEYIRENLDNIFQFLKNQ